MLGGMKCYIMDCDMDKNYFGGTAIWTMTWVGHTSQRNVSSGGEWGFSLPPNDHHLHPARPGVGKLPVAGVKTRMPVSPPQGHKDNSGEAPPGPTLDSCMVGESESTAYIKGRVEGIDVTVLIDSGCNVSLISEKLRMSIPALRKHVLNTQ